MSESIYPEIYFYRRLVQVKIFIDDHFNEPIHLHSIAGEAYFSRFHFIRGFKKYTS
ncbi:MAG: helix-turn-helix transcriptional regulator [Bacteroidota bacterium]